MDTRTSATEAAAAMSGVSETDQPSTTTITTVAVQAGKAKIVLAILKSHDWIRVRIQQMEPDIMEVGATLEEARHLRREHDELLLKLNLKQKDVTELLARADDLAVQNTSYQEVYSAMAKSLAEAWKDLNEQLEYRKMLLDQSIAFHESALQFSHRMEEAQDRFSSGGLAPDVESARHLLQQHQDMKKNILESSMLTLQEGQLLLDRIREMGMHAHVQNRHATTAACYGIEHLLELLQDRRRHLEELWLQRKIRLEQCLQLLLLDREVNKVSEWYEKVGDVYLSRKDLGDSLAATHALQEEQVHFEQQAKEIQETILRLIRTADQLVHSARSDAESVRKRLQTVDEKCESFMLRLDARRKHLALTRNFFTHAQMAVTKLDEIEIQLESTDLPRNSAALAERHAYLSHCIVEAVTPAIHEGRTLLERVGRDDPGAAGVNTTMTVLQERSAKLEEKCKARYEAGEQSQALNRFLDKYNTLNSWMTQIAVAVIGQHNDMGANLSSGRDFLELHERLNEDMKSKAADIASLASTADEIAKLGTPEAAAGSEKVKAFREQWQKLHTYVQQRIRLALSYVAFHKKAQQLAIQMDALEEYLRIEKLDPTQVSDAAIKHKEESFSHLNSGYTEVEHKGKHFIKEASEVKADEKLDTRRAVVVVETILSHFSERKYLITEYYEHWKVHITTGKQFKTQWHQFVQDARKTIDWLVKEEKELFVPYNAGFLGRNIEEAKRLQEKVDKFGPIAKKAQEEVEKHLKTAELLSLQGDTQGQRDQLVNELLRVHTRFQARINEYQILLKMTVKFFEDLRELDKLIEKTEREYAGTEFPKELTTAQLLLREHEASRNKIRNLIDTTAEEGEEIVIRVRQQDSEAVAKDEVQKVLQMTEERRRLWERTWEEQKARLEQNLQMCQFYFDLRQLHAELDELHRQLRARHGSYGTSLSSVKMLSQAFRVFENSVQLIEGKVKNFSNTADTMIRDGRYDSRRIRREVDDVERKWSDFHRSITEYHQSLDDSSKFFELMDECDGWINGAGQFLLTIGRKAADCKTSQDASALITLLVNFKDDGALKENERLNNMECIATNLYGSVTGPQKMQHTVDRNQEALASFVKAIEELAILRDNLLKKEQILAQMELVVEKKTPKQPRFVQPLQNAEITEGQRFTFECRLECDTKTPKIEWFKDFLPIQTPDLQATYHDGLCQLTIEETFSEDSAKYLCRATTDAGTAETTAFLKVKETHQKIVPPDFSRHLRSVDIPEGTALTLECQVSGIPSPTISWFRDEENIDNSSDYVLTKINGTCCLKIRKTIKDQHSAQFTCKASNPGGETASSARVQVITVRKPQFTELLKDTSVAEGKSVLLECRFTGEPPPQIQWLRNDVQILPSAVYKIIVKPDYTALDIKELFPEDAGSYTVIAKNLGGEARTSCLLSIEGMFINGELPRRGPSKPVFVQPLQNKDVQEGSRAHLRCVVQGFPQPEVVWYHNDKILKDVKDFELTFDGERASLIIREVYLEDSGDYRCVAKNSQGSAETSCRLIVEPLSEQSDGSATLPGDVVPPKFTQLLKDIEGVEGELVRFDCRVIGHPTPIIKWYRGRNQILTTADFLLTSERELHSLTIPETFKEDAGNYMVKATNAAGTAKCYASLIVKQGGDKHMMKTRLVEASHSSQRTVIAGHVPPEFYKVFRDMRVRPGESCTLEVTVSGHPRPQVRWLFNNEPIVSPDYQISSRGEKHILHIPEVFDEDAGRFSIVAENAAGKATCSALLVVVDESQILPRDDSPPETPQVKHQPVGFGPPPVVPIRTEPVLAPAPPKPVYQPPPPQPTVPKPAPPPVEVAPKVVHPPAPSPTYREQITVPPQKPLPKPSPPPVVSKVHAPAPFVPKVQPAPVPSPVYREELVTPQRAPPFQPVEMTIELPVPPQFIEPLRNLAAEEGTRVTFEGYVRGTPEPSIKWYKEGKQLTQSADFEITYRNGRVQLTIPEVFEEDSGKYVCQAQNKGGQVQSTAELIVKASMIPPQFVERLQTKEVKEGDAVRFTIRVSGKPPPEVTWYREGSKIVSSPDFVILQEGDLHTLYIPEVFYEDSGKFSVKADSKAGQTQCTAELIVEALSAKEESVTPSPPVSRSPSLVRPAAFSGSSREASPPRRAQFSKPLANQSAREGQRVTLECTIPAYPVPEKVQWFRNEIEIFTSPDYEISFSLGVCRLVIAEAFPEDSGKYRCTVTINSLPVSSLMQLTVEAAPKQAPSPRPPPDHRPQFVKQLTNQRLQHGGTAYFECKVDGYPPPEILWTRRGHPLVDKTRYKSTYDQYSGITTLTIFNLRDEDEGEYTCKAINSIGESSTSATLLSPDRFQDWERQQGRGAPSPAKFYRPPSAPVVDGRLSDGELLPSDEPFKVSHFEKRLTKEIEFRDEGKVHPKHFVREDKEAFDDSLPKEQVSIPTFEQKPKNFQLVEGADATFVCKVNATPLPNVQWYHNGRLIRPSNRYIMNITREGVCTLTIRVTLPEDAGHYTCCATNIGGRDTCSAELYVEGAKAVDETSYVAPDALRRMLHSPAEPRRGSRDLGGVSEKHFKPVFRKIPMDLEVPEGSVARFDCVVSGQPNPDMFWYRDGTEIFDDRYHKIVINEAGINSLIFDVTSRSDSGLYTCVASNAAGKDQFQVRLNILPRESASLPLFVDRMVNQTVLEGMPVSFEAEARGFPAPMMSWQRDGRMLSTDNQYHIQTAGGRSSLHIAHAGPEDNAWFQCTAANVAGVATNRARLIVQVEARQRTPERKLSIPRRVITPTSEISPQAFQRRPASEPQKPISSPVPDWTRVTAPVSAPRPIEPITPESHRSTADIILSPTPPPKEPSPQPWKHIEAPRKAAPAPVVDVPLPWIPPATEPAPPRVPASPVPKVESFARPPPQAPLSSISPVVATIDSKAKPSPRPAPKQSEILKYIQDDERSKAPHDDEDTVDSGRYPGEPRVKAPDMPAEDMFHRERPRPPKFKSQIKPLMNLSENQPAHFECRLVPVGDPDMQVEWYKDGVLLRHGHRFRPLHDFGFVGLDILYTYPEDNGIYMCKATNKFGSDSTQTQLQCFGKESVIYESQLPEGSDSVRQIQNMEDANYRRYAEREEDQPDRSPPIFDLVVDSQRVEEGETAKFMVKVSGNPRPMLKWWVNGTIACNSQRFRLRYDGMIHILEIPKARDYDSGTIRVVAKNAVGEAECSGSLTVTSRDDWRSRLKQTPKSIVETELDRKKHLELRTFELDQALKKPKTTVVELRAFERSAQEKAMAYKDDEVKKAFTDINLRHAQMARSDASKELRQHEPNVHIESEVHVARAKAMLNLADDYKREDQHRIVQKTQPVRKEPPTFTEPLSNVTAKEGQPVKMDVSFTGFPSPEIHWFREGIEIQPSRDFQITHLYQKSFLVIPEVFLEDAGTFMVRATSPYGLAECRALLIVEEDVSKVKETPPEFRVQMHDITIQIGEPATFDCQVLGYPKPEVYWTKDGRRVGDSPRCKLIVEDDHYTLLIYEVHLEDAGVYECVVINKMGKATCTARLNVTGKPEQMKPPSPPASHMAPQLLEPIRDQQTNEGDSIQFRCKIVGTPEPVVQWYYNNQIIKPSKYFQMTSENGYHTLAIAGVFPEDEGSYKCTARNPVGEVTCIGHLRVIPITVEPVLELTKPMEPPRFLKPINGFDVVEGGQAVFEVIVSGQPLPEVVWFHQGHQIHHGPDFEILRDGNRYILVIKEVLIEDAGIFSCRASNPAGVAECSAELFVEDLTRVATAQVQLTTQPKPSPAKPQVERRAPRILQFPAPAQDIQAGNTARLEVQVEAYPPPRFNWYLNNQPIQPSQKHKVSYDSGVVVLLIMNAQPQDSGDYVLRASNELGEISCKTTLNVKPTEKVVEIPLSRQSAVTITTSKHVVTQETVPTFVVPLKRETRVPEHSIAILEAQVKAYPPPRITWHVNGIEIVPSSKYIQSFVGDKSILEIRDVTQRDSGVYTVKASSNLGEAISSTTLHVFAPEPKPIPPKFTKNLDNVVATDGREVTLSCIVTGQPMPEISWFHNHRCIDKSEDFVITYDQQTGRIDLVIVDCLPDDQGRFRCIAKNAGGQAITECTLTVKPAPKPAGPLVEPSKDVKVTIQHQDVTKDTLDIEEQKTVTEKEVTVIKKIVKRTSGQPPRFTSPIQPCVVREGDSCTFTAVVTGAPQPEIAWLKDKVDLIFTGRHRTTFDKDTGTCTLTITIAEPSDVGVYSCRASNIAGRATCTANVVVVPPDAEVTITEKTVSVKKEKVTVVGEQETRVVESSPTFSRTLMPITDANEGDTIRFECQVSAEPEPTVVWLYNGQPLTSTQHITLTYDKTLTILTIYNATLEDTGEYICRATNALGEATTKTFLRVRKLEKEPVRPVPVQQPGPERDITIEFIQSSQTTGDVFQQGVPPVPLSEPCSVIPLGLVEEEPPRFTLPLRNQTVNDGGSVIFQVFFRGYPMPTVTWYFNSQPIQPSQDFKIHMDFNRQESTLVVVEVFPEDEGEYMCKAENALGTAITHCHLFVKLPSSSEEEGVEKIVSKTVEVVKTELPISIRETRRFSETIAIDHKQKLKEMAMQFKLPQPKKEKSELQVRRESVPKGMKLEVELAQQRTLTEKKMIEMKQRAEAIATQRQELMIPLLQHRRFSETVAIDHKKRPQEIQVEFELPKPRKETSQLTILQKAAPKGVKMEIELPEPKSELSRYEIEKRKYIETVETQRQEVQLQLEGSPPVFIWELQSQKVMDGDEVRFVCKVRGNPMPEITWYHNGKIVYDNPDFRTSYNKETGEVMLFIVEVFPQDTGNYECLAVNKYGKATTRAQLVVEVYEYIQDSEEATASQTESIISTSSMDETDFQAKTRRFLENMEKLRKEIQEEKVTQKFQEEVVEELDIEERGYEETILMADVKWQIPRRISPKREDVPVEKTEETVKAFVPEETKQVEIQSDIAKAFVRGANPSRVISQVTREVEEIARDLYATGAEMTEQRETRVEFLQPAVEVKPETRVATITEKLPEEATLDLGAPMSAEVMKQQEIVVEFGASSVSEKRVSHVRTVSEKLSVEAAEGIPGVVSQFSQQLDVTLELTQPSVGAKKETRVQSVIEKLPIEAADDLIASAASQSTQEQEYVVELVKPSVEQRRESRVVSVVEKLAVEAAEDLVAPAATESTQEHEYRVELAQPSVEMKRETRVTSILERLTVEAAEDLVDSAPSESTHHVEYRVDLVTPLVELKKETRVTAVVEKLPIEAAEDLIATAASESTQQDEYRVELVVPLVELKKETRVTTVVEKLPIEAAEDLIASAASESTQQEEYRVELVTPLVELKKETRVTSIVEKLPIEAAEDLIASAASESTHHTEYRVELVKPLVELKQESQVTAVVEQLPIEAAEDLIASAPSESTQQDEYRVELVKPLVESKKETRVTTVIEQLPVEAAEDLIASAASESMQQEDYRIELAQSSVETKQETRVTTITEKLQIEAAEDLAAQAASESMQQHEIVVEFVKPSVQERRESRVISLVDKLTVEAAEDLVAVGATESTQEHEYHVELAQPSVEMKQETRVVTVFAKLPVEAAEDLVATAASESTQQEEYVVHLVHSSVESKQEMQVQSVTERFTSEAALDFVDSVPKESMREEEIVIELAQPSSEDKRESRVLTFITKQPEDTAEDLYASSAAETTQEQEYKIDLLQPTIEDKTETRVVVASDRLAEEYIETIVIVEEGESAQEQEIAIEVTSSFITVQKELRADVLLTEKLPEEEVASDTIVAITDTSKEQEVVVILATPEVESKTETRVNQVVEKNVVETSFDLVASGASETTEHEEYTIDLVTPAVEQKKEMMTVPVDDKPVVESTFEMIIQADIETTREEEITMELLRPSLEQKTMTLVAPVEEKAPTEDVSEIVSASAEVTKEEQIVIELAKPIIDDKKVSRTAAVEEKETIESAEELIGEASEATQEEDYKVDLAQTSVEGLKETMVEPLFEAPTVEGVIDISEHVTEKTFEEEIKLDLTQQDLKQQNVTMVGTVEEKAAVELTHDFVSEATETTKEEEIVVELTIPVGEDQKATLVAPVEEKAPVEGIEDIYAQTTEETHHEQVFVQLVQTETRGKEETLAAPVTEEPSHENVEEIYTMPIDATLEQQVVVEFSVPSVESKTETLVGAQREDLPLEHFEESSMITVETTQPENIVLELSKPAIEEAKLARTGTQLARLAEEMAETLFQDFSSETRVGEEIRVQLDFPTKGHPLSSLASTQVAKLTEEDIEELARGIPSPTITEGTEIWAELAQPAVKSVEETRAEAVSEVLPEGTLEEHMEDTKTQIMTGEEIRYDLSKSSTKTKQPTHVAPAIDHLSEEEEEEIFFEAAEPTVPGEEVVVELGAADVKKRPQTLVVLQKGVDEEGRTDVGPEEFTKEVPRQEEIQEELVAAKKELPQISLVKPQEAAVLEPLKIGELQTEDIKKEITKESMTLVDFEKADSEAPKPSLVSIQEQVLNMQRVMGMGEYHEEWTSPALISSEFRAPAKDDKPVTLVMPIEEISAPESVAEEYVNTIKEVYMIPSEVQPEYEPAVVERYRFEARVHGHERAEASAHLAHIQKFAIIPTEAEITLSQADMEWHMTRSQHETLEERATEVTHEEMEMMRNEEMEVMRKYATEFTDEAMQFAQESYVSAIAFMAPVFELPLSDVTVMDGEKAILECRVIGTPRPEVTWYVDGMEIRQSADFRITYEEDRCILIIFGVLPEDEGEYTVKAVNEAGTCVTTAYLTVLPASGSEPSSPRVSRRETTTTIVKKETVTEIQRREEIQKMILERKKDEMKEYEVTMTISADYQAPQFTRRLEAIEVLVNQTVVLECDVIGFPEPEITWYQDGKKITSSQHIQIHYSEGKCVLIIESITVNDEAEYTCEARNEHGIATTWAEVLVESKQPRVTRGCPVVGPFMSEIHQQSLQLRSRAL